MAGEVATLATEATSYTAAALGAYGAAVLTKVRDEAADATIRAGRQVLQRIFGRREAGEELPAVLAEVIENPSDADCVAALRLELRKALESDAAMAAEVQEIIDVTRPIVSVTQHVTAGRDAYVAGRDMTITRHPD